MRPLSYWAAHSTTNLIDIFLQPAVFLRQVSQKHGAGASRCSGTGWRSPEFSAEFSATQHGPWATRRPALQLQLQALITCLDSYACYATNPCSVYCALTLPAIPFLQLYIVGVLVVWYCSRCERGRRRQEGAAVQVAAPTAPAHCAPFSVPSACH